MAAPAPAEQLLATLHVEHSSGDGSIVSGVVESGGRQLGLSAEQSAHLALAAAAAARAVYHRGFDDPDDAALDLTLVRVGHQVVVRIDDLGLPFHAEAADATDLAVIEDALRSGWLDELTHVSRGRDGNRTELIRNLDPGPDLRHEHSAGDDPPDQPIDQVPIAADAPLVSRMGEAGDAERLCQLTWRTYGYSYQHDEYYQPERLAAMIESGQQVSFVVASGDLIVGHSALLVEEPGAVVVEGGRAMVDPRFRGHHLMGMAQELRNAWLHEHGVLAIDGAAVTAHTRSQTDRAIASLQLGFLPAIEFRDIEGSEVGTREAVAGGLYPIAPIPRQRVALPARDAAMLSEIYRQNGLERTPLAGTHAPAAGTRSQLELEVRNDLGHAVVRCARIGADLPVELRQRVEAITAGGIEVVYADVPLDRPAAPWAAEALNAEGFILAGVLPLAHRGVDVVRYQRLGDTPVDPGSIHLKHPFSLELLAYVLAQHAELVGATA